MLPFSGIGFHDVALRSALAVSVCMNVYLLTSASTLPPTPGRQLSVVDDNQLTMRDCASVSCPAFFKPIPPIQTHRSVYHPFQPDTRFRRTPPHDMLDLTQKIYGPSARLGEPYLNFENPYGRRVDTAYQWTQINERLLDLAYGLLGGRIRLFVEVGSFIGKSSVNAARSAMRGSAMVAHRCTLCPTRRFSSPTGSGGSRQGVRRM